MNKSEKFAVTVYVVLSLATIVVLAIIASKKKKHCPENFEKCICQGGGSDRTRVCQNPKAVWAAYQNGLTEYSDFKPKGWNKVSTGDMDYPVSSGCPFS